MVMPNVVESSMRHGGRDGDRYVHFTRLYVPS